MVAGMLNPPIKLEDRIFIARVVLDPICFAVNADAPWKTFKELSDWAKVHSKELTWGSTGPFGTSAFGVGEWLVSLGLNPLDTRMVVSSGFAETIPRLLGGHIMLACQTVAEFYPLVKAGKVRALAVVSEKRNTHLPEIPTATEAGVPGLKGVNWWSGVSAAKGTPQYVVDKWAKVTEEMIRDSTFLEKMNNLHVTVSYVRPQRLQGGRVQRGGNVHHACSQAGCEEVIRHNRWNLDYPAWKKDGTGFSP